MELALDHCPHYRAGVGDGHPLPDSIWSTNPAGVEHPYIRAGAADPLDQHVRVPLWRQHEERRCEAGAEDGLGLSRATLGSSDLGRIAGKEVVTDLVLGERSAWWEAAIRIRRDKDHVVRVPARPRQNRVWNEVDRVSGA